jgi:osmotically-inducible protein OsmY
MINKWNTKLKGKPPWQQRTGFRAVVAIGALGMVAGAAAQSISDTEIMTAVEREYLYDDAVPFNRIDVHSEDGVITLTGQVPNLAARSQAEALAGIVKGVRSVVNRLNVAPSTRSAQEVEMALRQALSMDPATDRYEVDVSVDSNGVATLTGTTESWAERALTEQVAGTVAGVSRIENELTVDADLAHRGPGEISNEIEQRMRWDVRIDDSLVNVLVQDGGRVVLSGTVGSFAEKQHAEQLAWVNGVRSVDGTAVEVERWARDDDLRRNKYNTEMSDNALEAALMLALSYDPRVLEELVSVRVQDGHVWLYGEVDNLAASAAAARDARNTVGVDRVYNHLRVRRAVLTDRAIEDLARNALRGRGLLSDSVQMAVRDGRAHLRGDVDSLVEYWQINQTVESVRGVEELRNDLTVRDQIPRMATYWFGYFPRGVTATPGPEFIGPGFHAKTDRELHEDVASELFWSPFVDRDDIDFDVDDGTVTLRGTVESLREADAATLNAYQAGAAVVRNKLTIPGS